MKEYAQILDDYDHETFNEIGKLLCSRHSRWERIYLDIFDTYKYIVVQFRGGSISVRNANMNSLTVNLSELTRLLNGGYYDEVKEYLELKNEIQS